MNYIFENQETKLFINELVNNRRYLHEHPELSFKEFETQKYVINKLKTLKNLHSINTIKTGIIATFLGKEHGENIAFRADMDALPILEENTVIYASKNNNIMHACGHDAHTSILLALSKYIDENYKLLTGKVTLIFQHAEELPPGGAKDIANTNAFQNIDKIFGLHVDTTINTGTISVSPNIATSSVSSFEMKIIGGGGHSAYSNELKNPITVISNIIKDIDSFKAQKMTLYKNSTLAITQLNSGDATNVIPNKASLKGSLRTFDNDHTENIRSSLDTIIYNNIKQEGLNEYEFLFHKEYSPVINDANLYEEVKNVITKDEFFNFKKSSPMKTSEDFSSYTNEKKGCFILIGAKNSETGCDFPHHHPKFDIDENSMEIGLYVYIQLLKKYSFL